MTSTRPKSWLWTGAPLESAREQPLSVAARIAKARSATARDRLFDPDASIRVSCGCTRQQVKQAAAGGRKLSSVRRGRGTPHRIARSGDAGVHPRLIAPGKRAAGKELFD